MGAQVRDPSGASIGTATSGDLVFGVNAPSSEQLDAIQDSLNGRPRKTLGYLTPSEKLAEFIAPTA